MVRPVALCLSPSYSRNTEVELAAACPDVRRRSDEGVQCPVPSQSQSRPDGCAKSRQGHPAVPGMRDLVSRAYEAVAPLSATGVSGRASGDARNAVARYRCVDVAASYTPVAVRLTHPRGSWRLAGVSRAVVIRHIACGVPQCGWRSREWPHDRAAREVTRCFDVGRAASPCRRSRPRR